MCNLADNNCIQKKKKRIFRWVRATLVLLKLFCHSALIETNRLDSTPFILCGYVHCLCTCRRRLFVDGALVVCPFFHAELRSLSWLEKEYTVFEEKKASSFHVTRPLSGFRVVQYRSAVLINHSIPFPRLNERNKKSLGLFHNKAEGKKVLAAQQVRIVTDARSGKTASMQINAEFCTKGESCRCR